MQAQMICPVRKRISTSWRFLVRLEKFGTHVSDATRCSMCLCVSMWVCKKILSPLCRCTSYNHAEKCCESGEMK